MCVDNVWTTFYRDLLGMITVIFEFALSYIL